MRTVLVLACALLAGVFAVPASAQSATTPAIVGTWNGPFDGDSTGTYSMTVTNGGAAGLGGTLQVKGPDGGDGSSHTFKSVVAEGQTATLKYDTPDGAEVQIEVTIEGTSLTGKWKVVEAGTATVVQTGTLTGKKE